MPPSPHERTPRQQETMIFSSPEEANRFKAEVEAQISHASADATVSRAAVATVVEREFTERGEAVTPIREPWLHTPAEHAEVQHLVDLAFAKDLPAALKQARRSPHYPRNLDLLHDVITSELYQLLRQHNLNHQPLAVWLIVATGLVLLASLIVLGLIFVF